MKKILGIHPKDRLKNYILQEAIENAKNKDNTQLLSNLLILALNPHDEYPKLENMQRPHHKLSCSS